jgi:hypothetical protein
MSESITERWVSDFTPDSDVPEHLPWRTAVSARIIDAIGQGLPDGMPDDDRRRTIYNALYGELRCIARTYNVSLNACAAPGLPALVPFADPGLSWCWIGMSWVPRPDREGISQLVSAPVADGMILDLPPMVLLKLMRPSFVGTAEGGFQQSGKHEGRYLLAIEDMPILLQPRSD